MSSFIQPPPVESGEGIERVVASLPAAAWSSGWWNPLKELKGEIAALLEHYREDRGIR